MKFAYFSQPLIVYYRIKNGRAVSRLGGYGLLKRMRDEARLIGAKSTSTGKWIA